MGERRQTQAELLSLCLYCFLGGFRLGHLLALARLRYPVFPGIFCGWVLLSEEVPEQLEYVAGALPAGTKEKPA